jgi:HEAT repeat protein
MNKFQRMGHGIFGAALFLFSSDVLFSQTLPLPEELNRIRASGMSEEAQQQAAAQVYLAEISRRGARADEVLVLALQGVGLPKEQALPIFIDLLDNESAGVKRQTMWTLASDYGPGARAAVPKIVALFNEPGYPEQFYAVAARALGKIGAAEVIPSLIDRLDRTPSTDFVLKTNLIDALTVQAPFAQSALPVLRKQLLDSNTYVQFLAFRAIGVIQSLPKPSASQVTQMRNLRNISDDDLYPTFMGLIEAGNEASATVPMLLKAAENDPRPYVKCMALQALAATGGSSREAIESLVNAMDSDDEWTSMIAAQSFAQLRGSEPVIAVLARALDHGNARIGWQAAIALKRFGPAAAPAAASLAGALARADNRIPDKQIGPYLEALKSIGPTQSSGSETLVSLLSEQSPIYKNRSEYVAHHLRAFILATLAEIGVPKTALPYILDSLANSDDRRADMFAAAARAAGKLGPEAALAVPFLLRALKGDILNGRFSFDSFLNHAVNLPTTSCRIETLRALAQIGPSAKEALPVLDDFMRRYDPHDGTASREFEASLLYVEARKAWSAIQP